MRRNDWKPLRIVKPGAKVVQVFLAGDPRFIQSAQQVWVSTVVLVEEEDELG